MTEEDLSALRDIHRRLISLDERMRHMEQCVARLSTREEVEAQSLITKRTAKVSAAIIAAAAGVGSLTGTLTGVLL